MGRWRQWLRFHFSLNLSTNIKKENQLDNVVIWGQPSKLEGFLRMWPTGQCMGTVWSWPKALALKKGKLSFRSKPWSELGGHSGGKTQTELDSDKVRGKCWSKILSSIKGQIVNMQTIISLFFFFLSPIPSSLPHSHSSHSSLFSFLPSLIFFKHEKPS